MCEFSVAAGIVKKCYKNSTKDRWPETSRGNKKGKATKRPKAAQLAGIKKKGRKLVPLVVGIAKMQV
jgi:hypothetical protein